MKRSFLLILTFLFCKVHSYDLIEEMLIELKKINKKVDLLNEKAEDNNKIIEIIKEEMKEVRKNITNLDSNFLVLDSKIDMTWEDIKIVKTDVKNEIIGRLNSTQSEIEAMKTLG